MVTSPAYFGYLNFGYLTFLIWQVLLDTLLLSKSDFLLKPSSAVSEFAIYYNPRLANASYDFNLDGQPMPAWFSPTKSGRS